MRVAFNYRRLLALFLSVAVLASVFTVAFAGMATAAETQLDTSMTLYQMGNQLRNGKGEKVRLLGVNVPHYGWSLVGDNDAERALRIALNDWQSNCIRLAVKPSFWLGRGSTSASQAAAYRQRIDAFIATVTAAGKYVVLDNHAFYLPGEDSELFWADAAERYKNHPNVIFGLFNEPAQCTWTQFYEGAENYTYQGANDWGQNDNIVLDSKGVPNLLKIVRATGAKNVVTISGLNWGFDLEYMTEDRFREFAESRANEEISNNRLAASQKDAWVNTYIEKYGIRETTGNGIIFETHPYPDRQDWDVHLLDTLAEYPVLVGECGPTWLKDGITTSLSLREQAYMDRLTAYMDEHDMHLTAWAMGAWPHLVHTSNYNKPSAFGRILKDFIIRNVSEESQGSGPVSENLLSGIASSQISGFQLTGGTTYQGLTDSCFSNGKNLLTDADEGITNISGSGTNVVANAAGDKAGIAVNLGGKYMLTALTIYVDARNNSSAPQEVAFYAGNTAAFSAADRLNTVAVTERTSTVAKITYTFAEPVEAQYVKYLLTPAAGTRISYVSEIRVMGYAAQDNNGDNLLFGKTPIKAGVTTGTDYENLGSTGGNLGFEGLTDGIIINSDGYSKQDAQFWNGKAAGSKFVFTYDLGKNYDLGKVKVYALDNYQQQGVNQGIETWTFYASQNREDLFKDENKVIGKTGYVDPSDMTKELSMKQVRYVSLVVSVQDTIYGACRMSEIELYSAEQEETTPPTDTTSNSLLFGKSPVHAGVTTGTDYETLGSTGGNLGFEGLTDGIIVDPSTGRKQDAQFWNGKAAGSKFVFTYDLGKNYDLTSVKVYSTDNYQDQGKNQGIESWTFYASQKREDLFKAENKVIGKTGYSDPADMTKELSMKQVRYVSLVVSIQDTTYGACRMTELEVYGTESGAESDGGTCDSGHNWADATCTAPKTCGRCGATEGESLGHNWADATCTAPKTCGRCGATEGESLGHNWADATCTTPKTCSRCGATEGGSLGHNWKQATALSLATCDRCHTVQGTAMAKIGERPYASLADALAEATDNDVITLLANTSLSDVLLRKNSLKLDLNGFVLTAEYVWAIKNSSIVDYSAAKTGVLKVLQENITLNPANEQLAVWNGVDGFVFTTVEFTTYGIARGSQTEDSFTFWMVPEVQSNAMALLKEKEATTLGLTFMVRLAWTYNGAPVAQEFTFTDAVIQDIYTKRSEGQNYGFRLTVTGVSGANCLVNGIIISSTGPTIVGRSVAQVQS